MKTKIISKLKKELILVELPENGYYENYIDGTEIRDFLTDEVLVISKSDHTLLGSPDEIKEEDVEGLVEYFPEILGYQNFKDDDEYYKRTALESFHSALESEIYWENPIEKPKETNLNSSFFDMQIAFNQQSKFDEAQEKTFDKKRTLIFVKQ